MPPWTNQFRANRSFLQERVPSIQHWLSTGWMPSLSLKDRQIHPIQPGENTNSGGTPSQKTIQESTEKFKQLQQFTEQAKNASISIVISSSKPAWDNHQPNKEICFIFWRPSYGTVNLDSVQQNEPRRPSSAHSTPYPIPHPLIHCYIEVSVLLDDLSP